MIGNAHIDPVWLWTEPEGRAEVLASYRTAIGLIEDSPGYVFTSGGAVTYRWVAEDDPALLAAIQRAVARGQWALVNGWWLQPDCNIPDGESFARHALYGQRTLEAFFGRRATVGYNVDSFGHAGTLPQLLRLGGLTRYVFFRPGRHEKDLPDGPFWWEAPGGARVLACRPPLHYNSPEDADVAARIAAAAAEAPAGLPEVMCFYGVGNHGGGPTRRNVAAIAATQAESHPWRAVFDSPEGYFAAAEARGSDWPVVHERIAAPCPGLLHGPTRVKRVNRRAEPPAGGGALGQPGGADPRADPRARLQAAWEPFVSTFHDILAGTSIRVAYDDVCGATARRVRLSARCRRRSAALGAFWPGRPRLSQRCGILWLAADEWPTGVPLGGGNTNFTAGVTPACRG
jgi:alpha-mannosidase